MEWGDHPLWPRDRRAERRGALRNRDRADNRTQRRYQVGYAGLNDTDRRAELVAELTSDMWVERISRRHVHRSR